MYSVVKVRFKVHKQLFLPFSKLKQRYAVDSSLFNIKSNTLSLVCVFTHARIFLRSCD